MLKHTLAALALLALLTACDSGNSLRALREAEAKGDAYSKALAADYLAFAQEHEAAQDWAGADYFARKGLYAADGKDVLPEEPERWELNEAQLEEFAEARENLVKALVENRTVQPDMAASATVAYDRWLELAHNRADANSVAEQKAAFEAILAKLSEVHTGAVGLPTTTTPVESTATVLYFPFDSDHYGDSAKAVLKQLVRYVGTMENPSVTINGHADRAGTEEYNMDLSERRARYVLQSLKKAGVSEKVMHYFAFGESDPAVPTDDGVREPRNRRVEITVE